MPKALSQSIRSRPLAPRVLGPISRWLLWTYFQPNRPSSHIHHVFTRGFVRGRTRHTRPLLWSTRTVQPALHSGQTLLPVFRYHTRCLNRKSLSSIAPTGQTSTTLPWSLFSSGMPGNASISAYEQRRITHSSLVPDTSRQKRTHRLHSTQRSWYSSVREPTLFFGLTVFGSVMRLRALPYRML